MKISSDRFHKLRVLLESAANLAIVIAVAVGVTVWMRRPNTPPPSRQTNFAGAVSGNPAVGTKIDLPSVDWSTHPATLVVAISSACHYCIASTPFYSEITRLNHITPIVVVMPQPQQEAQAFLQQHAIRANSTVSLSLDNIQVEGTPTLLLVSSYGKVTKSWVGELSEPQQQEVLASLDHT